MKPRTKGRAARQVAVSLSAGVQVHLCAGNLGRPAAVARSATTEHSSWADHNDELRGARPSADQDPPHRCRSASRPPAFPGVEAVVA